MLEGKTAIVTGASRGIGRAIALELGKKGAYVVVNYNGSSEAAQETADAIQAAGGQAETYQCNVADYEACEKLINDVIGRRGRIDILVNNAGITRDNLLMRMSEEDFDAVLSTNLKGAFHTMRGRKCGPGQLCRIQGRRNRHDKISGKGAGKPGHYGECSSARLY